MSNQNLSFEDAGYRKMYWHTCSHIMAQALKRLYPEVKLAIGPAIENGFYYDIDAPFSFNPEIFEAIENEMAKICKENLKLERFELEREKANPQRHYNVESMPIGMQPHMLKQV